MPIVWSRKNNPYWPLPPDYFDAGMTEEGRRLARVNAASLTGRPDLEVAAWSFFRQYYLFPLPAGAFYKHGIVDSPADHAGIIRDWAQYPLSVVAAPRGFAKSTLIREKILKNLVTKKYWENLLFLAIGKFVTETLDGMMDQIDNNERIINDFGKLRPPKSNGIWNRQQIKLRNGSILTGIPITGKALGRRPHEMFFDDVEKSEDMVTTPADLRENFRKFMFNVAFPMSEEGVAMRVVGTLLNRRTFIYWMETTDEPQIRDYWHRVLLTAQSVNQVTGESSYAWKEKMSPSWLARRKAIMGVAAFNAQYMNDPGTEADRILQIHPELNIYYLENQDDAALSDPFNSEATMVSYRFKGWGEPDSPGGDQHPIPSKVKRPWAQVVSGMRRTILVDYAQTTTSASDFSAIHVVGVENSSDFKDTLYSLDLWLGRVRLEELVRNIYMMARKWNVMLIGLEAYPLQTQYYERLAEDLPTLYGQDEVAPRILPLKFPTGYSKADKIKGLEWRFRQFRLKLPVDRKETGAYRALWQQIQDFTEDLALLAHDDAIDSLAMHQMIGRPREATGPDIAPSQSLIDRIKNGEMFDEQTGIPLLSGLNASDLDPDAEQAILDHNREQSGQDLMWSEFI